MKPQSSFLPPISERRGSHPFLLPRTLAQDKHKMRSENIHNRSSSLHVKARGAESQEQPLNPLMMVPGWDLHTTSLRPSRARFTSNIWMDGCFFRGNSTRSCLMLRDLLRSIIIAVNAYRELIMCQPCSWPINTLNYFVHTALATREDY